jgi:hypothetical protein
MVIHRRFAGVVGGSSAVESVVIVVESRSKIEGMSLEYAGTIAPPLEKSDRPGEARAGRLQSLADFTAPR